MCLVHEFYCNMNWIQIKHKREVCIELLTFLLYTVKGESDKAQLLITMAFCYLGKEI